MNQVSLTLTVYFELPFWVGVFECQENGSVSVAKYIFGQEPSNQEIYQFVCCRFSSLSFSSALPAEQRARIKNPKRLQREARKEMNRTGISSKSQTALQRQYQEMKKVKKLLSREEKERLKVRKFQQKQLKKKEKHKGH